MLHEKIQAAIDQQNEWGGIDFGTLFPPTKLEVTTHNSVYEIDILNNSWGRVRIRGGKHMPEFREMIFMGSTWGGSMIRPGWIGYLMRMEFRHPTNRKGYLLTSGVKQVKIIGDGWDYTMDWSAIQSVAP